MIEKQNVVKREVTRCDLCARPAIAITAHTALCREHERLGHIKAASVQDLPLKNAADKLVDEYKK